MIKKLFSFKGRISRLNYGMTFLSYFLMLFAISSFIFALLGVMGLGPILLLLPLIVIILWFWVLFAQGAKRCHDFGKSGWFQIIPLYIFWMLIKSGDAGANRFGADPKIKSREMDDILDENL